MPIGPVIKIPVALYLGTYLTSIVGPLVGYRSDNSSWYSRFVRLNISAKYKLLKKQFDCAVYWISLIPAVNKRKRWLSFVIIKALWHQLRTLSSISISNTLIFSITMCGNKLSLGTSLQTTSLSTDRQPMILLRPLVRISLRGFINLLGWNIAYNLAVGEPPALGEPFYQSLYYG